MPLDSKHLKTQLFLGHFFLYLQIHWYGLQMILIGGLNDLLHKQTREDGVRHKPDHTCFRGLECPGCAFELGESLAKRKPCESAKYVWMVVGSDNPCDIRRYAYTHSEAVGQLAHAKKRGFKDHYGPGVWTLFKLVRVNREKP